MRSIQRNKSSAAAAAAAANHKDCERRWNEKKQNEMCNHFIRGENSRIRGVLLAAELTVAVGGVDNLPGVTVDPRWKEGKHISIPRRPHAGSVFPITQLKLMTFLKARPNHFGLNQLDFAQMQVRLAKTAAEMNSVIGKHARRAICGKNKIEKILGHT